MPLEHFELLLGRRRPKVSCSSNSREVTRYPTAVDESLDYLSLQRRELFELFR
jgi:hypothetical protein